MAPRKGPAKSQPRKARPLVGIIMGSQSDWATMEHAAEVLAALKVPAEHRIVSAHRTPQRLYDYAHSAHERGIQVIIAGAGGAAHLPGMAAAMTHLPVLGVPVESKALKGLDSLLSIQQMPGGIPVGALAVGKAGAINAGLLAAAILALHDPALSKRLQAWRAKQTRAIKQAPVSEKNAQVNALPPGSRIGILGGGQLGRMLATAASQLGYHCHIFAPEADPPAAEVAATFTRADYTDAAAMDTFARACDVVTYEFENIPFDPVAQISKIVPVRPGTEALRISQDRLFEKQFCNDRGIATAPWRKVGSVADLEAAIDALSLPLVLKTCRMGYDGKGQVKVAKREEAASAFAALNSDHLVAEGFVSFKRELSVVLARGLDGRIASWGPVENIHRNHILWRTYAPARIDAALAAQAEQIAASLAAGLDYVGTLAVELFDCGDRILVNEMAPRVHNSGHWTMDAAVTSQFEQHIRAICGLPLGSADRLCDAVMENLIGDEIEAWPTLLAESNAKLHLYGKAEARPGRKMGHVNRLYPAGQAPQP